MHARHLIDFAVVLANYQPSLRFGDSGVKPGPLSQYWAVSKCRFQRWYGTIGPRAVPHPAAMQRAVLEEVLLSEVLTRVWTAIIGCGARQHGDAREATLVVESVWFGHLEARRWVLARIADDPTVGMAAAVELNRVRRKCELWSDLLLGMLRPRGTSAQFAHSTERLQRFERGGTPAAAHSRALLETSARIAFSTGLSLPSPNGDLHAKVAGAILGSLDDASFESTGLLKSLWMRRLESSTDDAELLIDEALGRESEAWDSFDFSAREGRIGRFPG